MRTSFLITFFLLALSFNAKAQKLIAVQNVSSPTFFTLLDTAIVHAQNGDTIYLPGGTFPLTVAVSKRLHIIGVGSVIDSALATGTSRISGNLTLNNNASYGSLVGIYLTGTIITGANITNYAVQRCYLSGLSLANSCSNWTFIENNIQGISSNAAPTGASSCYFYNNIFGARICYSSYIYYVFIFSVFKNNVFAFANTFYQYNSYWVPITAQNSTFENNIFVSVDYTACNQSCGKAIANSALHNNLFVTTSYIGCENNWGSNNIFNQALSTIFGTNYQLLPTCPGKNAGKDGTDIGIYGGSFPWKAGSVPPNPHIQSKNVAGNVDANGNLNVIIKVEAQDR